VKTRGMSKEKMLQRAIDFARDNGGQNTSSDFSVALENLMHKALLGEYAQQQDTWRRFCGVDSVPDFRTSNRYRLGSFGVLDTLEESGEYKQKQIPDAVKQTISTETYGQQDRALAQGDHQRRHGRRDGFGQRFGRMAGLSIEKAVYDLLARTAVSVRRDLQRDHCSAVRRAVREHRHRRRDQRRRALCRHGEDGEPGRHQQQREARHPAERAALPLALGGKAKQFNRDTYDPTAARAFQASNKVANMFRDIIDTPRLSGTRRYTFSDQTPALLVVFLNGSQVPVMEQRPGWDIDGIEWKIRLDVNAQGFDPKGAVTNAGT
jgi:hypothetical protein